MIAWAQALEQWAPDHAQVLDEFAALLVRVALVQAVPDYDGDELYEVSLLQQLAQGISPEDVQLYYQTAIIGRRDLHLAPEPRAGFEMTLLRMVGFRYAGSGLGSGAPGAASATGAAAARSAAGRPPRPSTAPAAPAAATVAAPAAMHRSGPTAAPVAPTASPVSPGPTPTTTSPAADCDWAAMVAEMGLSGAVRSLALNCQFLGHRDGAVRLALDPRFQAARTPNVETKLSQALSAHLGGPVRLEFVTDAAAETPAQVQEREGRTALLAARQAFGEDPTVKALQERFGATLLPDTIRPTRTEP